MLLVADVNQAIQERARGNDESAAGNAGAVFELETGDSPGFASDPSGTAEDPGEVRLGGQRLTDPPPVGALVCLGSRGPDSGAAAPVEQFELNSRGVNRAPHQSAKGVDFADQMTLGGPANGRIAGHERHGLGRKSHQTDAAAHPRGSPRGFAAGMSGANHNDVEILRVHREP